MKRVLVSALIGPLAACGNGKSPNNDGITGGTQSPNNITLVAPSHPRGSVSGQIVNSALGPISGATILLNLAEPATDVGATTWSTTSDSAGNFSINFLPAGAVILVTASAAGYATVRKQVVIPASAGTFPIDNGNAVVGPLLLTKLDGSLKILVLDHNGNPAPMAKVTLEAQPAGTDLSGGGTYGTALGTVVAQSATDANGNVTLSNIPDADDLSRLGGGYTLTIPALTDQNGNPTSGGTVVSYSGRTILLDPSVRVVQLPGARSVGPLSVVASNVQSMSGVSTTPLNNLIATTGSIYVVFNQAIQTPSFRCILADEYGKTAVAFNPPVYSENNDMVQIQPTAPLNAGQEYNLFVRADSLDNGSSLTTRGFFFSGDPASPQNFGQATNNAIAFVPDNTAPNTLNPGDTIVFNFNQPVGVVGSPILYVFFDLNLGGTAAIGDAPGEQGNAVGFTLFPYEPTNEPGTLFTLMPSGYTSRWAISYNALPGDTTPLPTITAGTVTVVAAFSKIPPYSGATQNIWGVPVLADLTGPITRLQ
jgi:hypothetical protein